MRWALCVLILGFATPALGHKLDPGMLSIQPVDDGYAATWSSPRERWGAMPLFPTRCRSQKAMCHVKRGRKCLGFLLQCGEAGLAGQRIAFEGSMLPPSVLVQWISESGQLHILRAEGTPLSVQLPQQPSNSAFSTFLRFGGLGVEHLISGLDHLLFVLGLVLLIPATSTLIWTITAFTAGHSLTLVCAALGWISVPVVLVEVLIALSIGLLAVELTLNRETLTRRYPWLVAGVFGLFHGLGFASGLVAIGLPEGGLLEALAGFNVGVEAGQIAFVLAILAVSRVAILNVRCYPRPAAYVMGSVACAWAIERTVAVWQVV